MDLSVVIPLLNEEENINELFIRLSKVLEIENLNYEIILVNDGSIDNTQVLIEELSKTSPKVRYITFTRCFGHQLAISAGLKLSSGNKVILMDGDLQDPPELITELIKESNKGYPVVYAKRKSRKGESFFKKLTAKVFYRLLKLITNTEIPLDSGDFRIIDRRVVNDLVKMPEKNKFLRGQIAWLGYKQSFIEFDREPRFAGKPAFTYKKLFKLAMDGITSFSDVPLKLATRIGFLMSLFSFIVILYALYSYFILHRIPPGWTSLIISSMFVGGVQLLAIGIIGEYIGRLIHNVRNRPDYIIEKSNIIPNE